MSFISRIIDITTQAAARRREQRYITNVLNGPDSAFRSELIDTMSSRGTYRL